jgi:hypothetical protein
MGMRVYASTWIWACLHLRMRGFPRVCECVIVSRLRFSHRLLSRILGVSTASLSRSKPMCAIIQKCMRRRSPRCRCMRILTLMPEPVWRYLTYALWRYLLDTSNRLEMIVRKICCVLDTPVVHSWRHRLCMSRMHASTSLFRRRFNVVCPANACAVVQTCHRVKNWDVVLLDLPGVVITW